MISKSAWDLYTGWVSQKKETVSLYKGEGCDACGGTGYKGRVGIYEVLVMTEKIGKLI